MFTSVLDSTHCKRLASHLQCDVHALTVAELDLKWWINIVIIYTTIFLRGTMLYDADSVFRRTIESQGVKMQDMKMQDMKMEDLKMQDTKIEGMKQLKRLVE